MIVSVWAIGFFWAGQNGCLTWSGCEKENQNQLNGLEG
jgi:hypothetical protein